MTNIGFVIVFFYDNFCFFFFFCVQQLMISINTQLIIANFFIVFLFNHLRNQSAPLRVPTSYYHTEFFFYRSSVFKRAFFSFLYLYRYRSKQYTIWYECMFINMATFYYRLFRQNKIFASISIFSLNSIYA